jgi:hypothetical protein
MPHWLASICEQATVWFMIAVHVVWRNLAADWAAMSAALAAKGTQPGGAR